MAEVKVWRDEKTGNWYAQRYMGATVDGKKLRPTKMLVGAETYAEAKAMADEWSETLDIDWLSQGLKLYLEHVERFGSNRASGGPKPNTTDAYYRDMDKVLDVLGDKPLAEVSTIDVEHMNARLRARGLSSDHVKRIDHFLSGAFQFFVQMKMTKANPVHGVRVSHPDAGKLKRIPLTDAESNRVSDAADYALVHLGEKGYNLRELVRSTCAWLALRTGMRVGEICALRQRDLQVGNGGSAGILVQGTVVEKPRLHRQPTTKSNEDRVISVGPEVVERLGEVVKREEEELGPLGPDSPLLTWRGTWERPSVVSGWVSRNRERLGLPKRTTFHTFRHTHVSYLVKHGVNIVIIAHRLGHSDPAMTLRKYSHMFMNDLDRAAAEVMTSGYAGSASRVQMSLAQGRENSRNDMAMNQKSRITTGYDKEPK